MNERIMVRREKAIASTPVSIPSLALQRRTASSSTTSAVPPIVHNVLATSGQSLDSGVRSFMEPRFGHNFNQVRVHNDVQAAESAQAVNALAYTMGQDVVFGAGQYAPETMAGKRLLAHELTHVVQQQSASTIAPQTKLAVSSPDDATEKQADQVARVATAPEEHKSTLKLSIPETSQHVLASPTLQRQPKPATAPENSYHRIANDITGAFEGGKTGTLNLYDRGIISYGKHQATLASGTLYPILRGYTELSQSETAEQMTAYLERVKKKDASLHEDKAFIQLLKDAAGEPEMHQAQEAGFTQEYWEPAKKKAGKAGVKSALGYAIFYDTKVQGGLGVVLESTKKRLGGMVGDTVEGKQITEQEFLQVFMEERQQRHERLSAKQTA